MKVEECYSVRCVMTVCPAERRRSRSTSRERERRRRERDRSRSRDRDRDRRRSRSRSPHRRRSRSPRRHRSSSLSPGRQKDRREDDRKEMKEKTAKPIQISAEDMQGKTEEEIEMMKLMGFASFDSTKVRAQGCPILRSHRVVQFITKSIATVSKRYQHSVCLHSFLQTCLMYHFY